MTSRRPGTSLPGRRGLVGHASDERRRTTPKEGRDRMVDRQQRIDETAIKAAESEAIERLREQAERLTAQTRGLPERVLRVIRGGKTGESLVAWLAIWLSCCVT